MGKIFGWCLLLLALIILIFDLQWGIWFFGLLVTLLFLRELRKDAKTKSFGTGRPVHVSLIIQNILLLLSVTLFLVMPWNQLHLLWVIPACFLLGFFLTLVILPIPFIGNFLKIIILVFANIFFFGIDWEIGGSPWNLSWSNSLPTSSVNTRQGIEKMTLDDSSKVLDNLQEMIQYQKDQIFGIGLFFQIISRKYEKQPSIVEMNLKHYESIKNRTEDAIEKAETLLEEAKKNHNLIEHILNFEFPPTIDSLTNRAQILAKKYETLFPNRLRSTPLSEDELELLHVSAVEEFFQKE